MTLSVKELLSWKKGDTTEEDRERDTTTKMNSDWILMQDKNKPPL